MDAGEALRDLTEISSQIQAAVLLDAEGATLASTLQDDAAARRLSDAVRMLMDAAAGLPEGGGRRPVQLEAATSEGSLFVVRHDQRLVGAVTRPEPTAGLVFFDLKSCLRAAAAEQGDGKPRPHARREKAAAEAGE